MSRSTKLIVFASNLASLWLVATLVSRGIPRIILPTLAAFVVFGAAAYLIRERALSVVMATLYAFPALAFAWFGNFIYSYYAIWLAALTGAMLPRAMGSPWAYPRRFAWPLVLWALALALSWPMLVLREVDFQPALLSPAGMGAAVLPQSPAIVSVWIASVASIVMSGLLLLDWCFLEFTSDGLPRFERRVIGPLLAGALIAAVIAIYQAVVDITFLNQTLFASIGRVVGTMRDANPFGAVMAMWLPVAAAMMLKKDSAAARLGWVGAFVAFGIAVWASGSRTALLGALVALVVLAWHVRGMLTRKWAAAGSVAAVAVAVGIVSFVPSTSVGRAKAMLPSLSGENLRTAAYQLWSRDLYGTVALEMISEHPFVGIGTGGYNYQYSEVLARTSGANRPPDNAQNWFRQQLAELGLLGSIGWISFLLMFGWLLMSRSPKSSPMVRGAIAGATLGLAAASLLGMPTQDAAASLTFIVFAAWYIKLTHADSGARATDVAGLPAIQWAVIVAILAAFLGGTLYTAQHELRPPVRAQQIHFPYRYGFAANADDPSERWTGPKAVEVVFADKRWMKLELGQVAPDAEAHPVQVRISLNQKEILRLNRRGNFPVIRWIRMPAYQTPLLLEIEVDRTFRPAVDGTHDDPLTRDRGIAVRQWTFTDDDPPKGSITIESPDLFRS